MERELFVYVEVRGEPVLAGRLWTRVRQRAESATFLYDRGWLERSDSFALEPALPLGAAPRILSTAIHPDDATASLELALEAAPYFDLDPATARATVAEVARATAPWRETAKAFGLTNAEASRMASAFEHGDRELAERIEGGL